MDEQGYDYQPDPSPLSLTFEMNGRAFSVRPEPLDSYEQDDVKAMVDSLYLDQDLGEPLKLEVEDNDKTKHGYMHVFHKDKALHLFFVMNTQRDMDLKPTERHVQGLMPEVIAQFLLQKKVNKVETVGSVLLEGQAMMEAVLRRDGLRGESRLLNPKDSESWFYLVERAE